MWTIPISMSDLSLWFKDTDDVTGSPLTRMRASGQPFSSVTDVAVLLRIACLSWTLEVRKKYEKALISQHSVQYGLGFPGKGDLLTGSMIVLN